MYGKQRRSVMSAIVLFFIFSSVIVAGMNVAAIFYGQWLWEKQSMELKKMHNNDLSLEHSSQWI